MTDKITVIEEIATERRRQMDAEGWTLEHDDRHAEYELSRAAAMYARHAANNHASPYYAIMGAPEAWPWEYAWWKPKDPRRDLIRAAALIVAEIERLDRAGAAQIAIDPPGGGRPSEIRRYSVVDPPARIFKSQPLPMKNGRRR